MDNTRRITVSKVRKLCPTGTRVSAARGSTDESFYLLLSHEDSDQLRLAMKALEAEGLSCSRLEIRGSRWDWDYTTTAQTPEGNRFWP